MNKLSRLLVVALLAGSGVAVLSSAASGPPPGTPQRRAQPTPAGGRGDDARYIEYARAAADFAWDHREENLARWRAQFDPASPFGYRAPGNLLETALIYSYLFEKERVPRYADRAREILVTYGDYRSAFPDWAIKKRPDYDHGSPPCPTSSPSCATCAPMTRCTVSAS